jgi:stage II sporulation protein D
MATACDFVNLRASASTGAAIRAQVRTGTAVTVVATVTGTRWTVACPRSAAASTWYRISAIGGRSVSSLYGVSYLYGATALFAPAPGGSTATPTPAGITPLGATVTFFGRGYGHGVGLSQYGARGRALDGQDAATILAHYFQGTTIGTVPLDTQIRVLVLESAVPTAASPLIVVGRGGGWTLDGIDATFPADARLRLLPVAEGEGGTWRALVDAADGSILSDTIIGKSIRVRPASDETTLQLWSKPSAYDLFRGVLRIVGTTTVDVVNELPLETYLRGVVPAEMPSSWPVESIRAQAIAARSYAAFRLRPGSGTFDVYDDTRSQVYQGVRREQPTTDAALEASAGQVLRSGSAIVNAFFHSTGGGATEDNENAFVSSSGARVAGPVSYLRGSADRRPDGTAFDDGAPYATWRSASYSIDALSAIFAADPRTDVGTLLGLDLRDRGVSGRLVSITLVGTTGSRTVSGDVFRAVFSAHRPAADPVLRSNLLDLSPIP